MQETTINGVTTNPFKIIQATDKIGKDAQTVENTDASNGVMAQVYGPNQVVMDTGYFSANEFIGPHHIDVRWFSDLSSGDGLTLEYWKKDENEIESMSISVDIPWHSDISPEFGSSGESAFFVPNTQCRFIIKTHSSVPTTNYVGVDFLKITVEDLWSTSVVALSALDGAPFYTKFDGGTIDVTVGGNPAKYIYTANITNWDPTTAVITATTTNEDYFSSITTRTSSSFTITVKHRNDVSASDSFQVFWQAQIFGYYVLV